MLEKYFHITQQFNTPNGVTTLSPLIQKEPLSRFKGIS